MALAGAGWAEEEGIGVLGGPAGGGQLVDEGAVHLLVEVEVKGIEPLGGVAEARLLQAPFEEPILPADELVLDEAREEIDGGQLLGLRLEQADLQPGRDARAAELAQGALQFDDVHEVTSWIFRAMTSR